MTDTPKSLERALGVRGVFGIALNGTIGAGIFGVPAAAIAQVGPYSPLLFVICALLLAPVLLTFAEVASGRTGTGGPALYLQEAAGPAAGFLAGWTFYLTRVSASAANLGLILVTTSVYWPELDEGPWRIAALALLCFALTVINVVGTARAARAIDVLTLLKFLPLLAVVFAGIALVFENDLFGQLVAEPVPSADRIGVGLMLVIYAFVGWESAVVPGGEVRDVGRTMPRALLLALGVVTVLYVLIQSVCAAAVPNANADVPRVLVDVGELLFGPTGAVLLTVGVAVSVAGNVASAALSTPRITYALARDGLLPPVLGRVHSRFRTPAASIVGYGVLTFALAASGSFVFLAGISVLTRLLIYAAVSAAAPKLRRGAADGAIRLPGGLALPICAVVVSVLLMTRVALDAVWLTAAWSGSGVLLYAFGKWCGPRLGWKRVEEAAS